MSNTAALNQYDPNHVFSKIALKVSEITGVQLGEKQEALVHSQLSKRIRSLGIESPQEYERHFESNKETELNIVISLLTTHHSFFFREFVHFEFIQKNLGQIVKNIRLAGRKKIKVWSAACSRGQEVYSLAMFFKYHLKQIDPSMDFEILGSDVDEASVKIANNGVYKWDEIKKTPSIYLENNWLRGTNDISDYVKANGAIKQKCRFLTINLLDFKGQVKNETFDIIICRNVFIYFDNKHVEQITNSLLKHLAPTGYFIIGLSESLSGTKAKAKHLGQSIYCTDGFIEKSERVEHQPSTFEIPRSIPSSPPMPTATVNNIPNELIRVIAVDDSPTVLKVLSKILTPDKGFNIVATAKDGLEAAKAVKANEADVMTLDIHMPNMDGVEYLHSHFNDQHPPVVIVSSVAREDSELAMRALDYGAFDYVEKPTLENLIFRGDEIRTKLNCAYKMRTVKIKHEIDKEFAYYPFVTKVAEKLKIFTLGVGNKKKLIEMLKQVKFPQPPIVVLFEGVGQLLHSLKEETERKLPKLKISLLEDLNQPLSVSHLYFADINLITELQLKCSNKQTTICMFGDLSSTWTNKIKSWQDSHLIVEDVGIFISEAHKEMSKKCKIYCPYTSFAYETDKILADSDTKKG